MSALRFKSWRITLLPIILLAVILLPTLHHHSAYTHDKDVHVHQHAIIHADYLSTAAQEHGNSNRENVALNSHHLADFSQTNFSTLTVPIVKSVNLKLTHVPRFLAIDVEENNLRLVPFARVFKQEHPAPPSEVSRSPVAPRSPPVLA
jgi:hypothetical protein